MIFHWSFDFIKKKKKEKEKGKDFKMMKHVSETFHENETHFEIFSFFFSLPFFIQSNAQ